MCELKAGFTRTNINPMMGIPIRGYYKERLAMRGNERVSEQCLLTAAVQNMKKIANILWKRDREFLSRIIKNLIYTTQTHLKMVGLSVV